jgi:putative spermidine/putrescine transport system ATP-binding protein
MTHAVEFRDVSRHYGKVRAVDRVSIAIEDGEFFSMLGPSGSGKTTCLRLIAGFEQPSAGSIRIHAHEAAGVPPFARDVNTVFQDYALFPHMDVRDNVAYGLMVKGVAKADRYARSADALAMVALESYGGRKPSQLSGGQRQRVALARALVNRPRVLLLDEPLGALDLKLREQMQGELKSLQRKLGITFVYVTHDQGEALSMSDRVAVFNEGRIEQVASPRELYLRPATAFVARFVGTSNVFSGAQAQRLAGEPQAFSLRPENIRLLREPVAGDAGICLAGRVEDVQYHGASSRIELQLADGLRLVASINNQQGEHAGWPAVHDSVYAAWPRQAMVPLREPPP